MDAKQFKALQERAEALTGAAVDDAAESVSDLLHSMRALHGEAAADSMAVALRYSSLVASLIFAGTNMRKAAAYSGCPEEVLDGFDAAMDSMGNRYATCDVEAIRHIGATVLGISPKAHPEKAMKLIRLCTAIFDRPRSAITRTMDGVDELFKAAGAGE